MNDKSPSKSEEFSRFEKMTKKLVNVPKKDIQDHEKKQAQKDAKKPVKV